MVTVTGPTAFYCGGFIRVTVEAEYAAANSVTVAPDFLRDRGRSVDPDYVSDAEAAEICAAACATVRDFLAERPAQDRPLRVRLVHHRYHPVDSGPFSVGAAAVRAVRAAIGELAKTGPGGAGQAELLAA